jgi:hypothetical protein
MSETACFFAGSAFARFFQDHPVGLANTQFIESPEGGETVAVADPYLDRWLTFSEAIGAIAP